MAIFGYCLFRMWTKDITYGTMTLFLAQSNKLASGLNALISIFPSMINSAVSAHRVREIVELPREVHDTESLEKIKPLADAGLSVCMKNVKFSYIEDNPVITDSQFEAHPGEIVAMVGSSGEGKTTMLRLILGLIRPQQGEVLLVAEDQTAVTMNADLRQLFAYVPQGNTLVSGTIAENLQVMKPEATEAEIVEALQIACAWEFVSNLEGGIHFRLGEHGHGVSEGQAQRIAIARAVLRNAPILLLDEATSALDIDTEEKVLANIVRRRPDRVCIVSTHRQQVLSMCQRIYRVEGHKIMEIDSSMVHGE